MNSIDLTLLKISNYNRKSSESEDKQMLSNEAQVNEAVRCAEYHNIKTPFAYVFQEAKSAKKENKRPEFLKMMDLIENGKVDGIICWKLDRLARNMTEGGMLIDKLSSGKIKAIITHDKVFYPWDNVLAMAVEFGQGSQFLKDLSVNVKRGQKIKAEKGVPHGVAALGFLNDKTEEKGNRKWLVDAVRLEIIRILLKEFLKGTYSAGKLHKYAIGVLKLTTVKRKRSGGNLIAHSRIYEILNDPIYAGFFYQAGVRYELDPSLPRLITESEHNKIKNILSRKNIPKTQHHEAVFSGYLTSSFGNYMGPDIKFQVICDCKFKFAYKNRTHCPECSKEIEHFENPKYLNYSFYYDVKRKKENLPYVRVSENNVLDEVLDFVDGHLNFSIELIEWSKKYIHELKNKELVENVTLSKRKEERKIEFVEKKARMRALLRDGQVTNEEYQLDIESLNRNYADLLEENGKVDWYSEMIEIADLTKSIIDTLKDGTYQSKREMLSKLGSNLTWNGEELIIINKKSIRALTDGIKLAKELCPKFEPKISIDIQGLNEKTSEFSPVFSALLAWQSDFRTYNWAKAVGDPDLIIKEVNYLISLI